MSESSKARPEPSGVQDFVKQWRAHSHHREFFKWTSAALLSIVLVLSGGIAGATWGSAALKAHEHAGHPGVLEKINSIVAIQDRQLKSIDELRRAVKELSQQVAGLSVAVGLKQP